MSSNYVQLLVQTLYTRSNQSNQYQWLDVCLSPRIFIANQMISWNMMRRLYLRITVPRAQSWLQLDCKQACVWPKTKWLTPIFCGERMTFDVFRDRLYWKTTKVELSPVSSIFNGTIPGAAPSLVSAWAWLPARRHGLPEKEPGELGTTGWAWGTLKSCRNIRGDAQIFFIFPRGFFPESRIRVLVGQFLLPLGKLASWQTLEGARLCFRSLYSFARKLSRLKHCQPQICNLSMLQKSQNSRLTIPPFITTSQHHAMLSPSSSWTGFCKFQTNALTYLLSLAKPPQSTCFFF